MPEPTALTPGTAGPAVPDREHVPGGEDVVAVAIRGLVKRYPGDVGVLGVDLQVRRHEVLGLVGPNGAGKTTLLALLCDLIDADAGSIDRSGRFALCADTPEFEPWLTGTEVLRQSFSLVHPKARLDRSWLRAVVADTGLESYVDRRCGGYSRGMTQRLGIAAALVVDPDVLVLDEPTSALDAAGRADVLSLIERLRADRTVVLSSHALADVQRTADTIAVMDAGRLLFTGPPATLINEHLRPTWRVTLTHDAAGVVAALAGHDWVCNVRPRGTTAFDVEVRTLTIGEQRLVPILADLGARVLSLVPIDADLESAFFALTGRAPGDERP